MKRSKLILLACVLTTIVSSSDAQPNFVPITDATLLIVTHSDLRTPGWYPGMTDAWETSFLDQKQSQGLTTSIYEIGDNVAASTIKEYIDANGPLLKYVYIIGDADHPDFVDEENPLWPLSNSSAGIFVPFYGKVVDPGVFGWNVYAIENDFWYMEDRPTLTIGRLPAQSHTEIQLYLGKCASYLSQVSPAWAKRQLLAFDNDSRPWTGTNNGLVGHWVHSFESAVPTDWTTTSLLTTNYTSRTLRENAFRDQINAGCGVVVTLGAAAHFDNVNYFLEDDSPYTFSNSGQYPLMIGNNCSIGAVQRPDGASYDSCVVEKLLFLQNAGLIAAIAPTKWTVFLANYRIAKETVRLLSKDNYRTFGGLFKRVISLKDSGGVWGNIPDCSFLNLVLLGDPTLRYPLNVVTSGQWSCDISPVIVMDSLRIENGDSLIIEPGVEVLFGYGACLVVDSGAKLIVCGTETDSVRFSAKDAGETWNGIYVNRGQLDISYATFHDCYQNAIHTDYPKGSDVPVSIRNCYINGSKARPSWALILQLFNSPALKHQVNNCVIDSVAGGNGMYLYNCNVEFCDVTIRNCMNVNSYIKKVTGSFHSCVFEGRTLDYGVLLNSATCNPTFKCCSFLNLAPVTGYFATVFSATGCNPTFGNGLPVLPNTFADTSTHLLAFQGEGLLPIIFKRGNNFYQRNASGKFVEWQEFPLNPVPFYIENQYWEPTASINYFTPSTPAYWRYSTTKTSPYSSCNGGISMTDPGHVAGRDRTLDEDSLAMDTLDYAIQLEVDEDFAAAQAIYLYLVRTTEDWQVRWQAATRLVTTEVHLGNGGQWLENLIDSLMAAESYAYEAAVHGRRLMANYRLNHEEYQPAIDICLDLLESGLLFHDSIAVAMELIGIQMAAGVQEGVGGGLDENRWARIPDGLKIRSFTHGMEVEKKLLHLLGSGGHQIPEPREIVPTAFQLYQNHPNPFNPTTEIRFDLPEALRVELKVFNTLGQLVTTLADETRPAGAYRILWDGKNVSGVPMASGVYVYQLKAGNFTDAKKMVLIR